MVVLDCFNFYTTKNIKVLKILLKYKLNKVSKKKLKVFSGSASTRLNNPLGGVHYSSYGCALLKSRQMAASAVGYVALSYRCI